MSETPASTDKKPLFNTTAGRIAIAVVLVLLGIKASNESDTESANAPAPAEVQEPAQQDRDELRPSAMAGFSVE